MIRRLWKSHREFVSPPAFWGLAALKLASGTFLTSHYLDDLFIPFVRYFVDSGFSNPWNEFLRRGVLDAFPYSGVMLAFLAVPQWLGALLFGGSAHVPWAVEHFLLRLPLLAADAAIYLVLCRWFETRWKTVLLMYWASPILFYISYVHGQLDVIPTAFLFLALWYAIGQSPARAGLLLGTGIAAKFHLLAVVPLMAFFLFKKTAQARRIRTVVIFLGAMAAALLALIGPFLFSEGYRVLVLGAKESGWIYQLTLSFPQGMQFFLCPAAVLLLILHFFSYERITQDVLVLYIGLVYAVLLLLVPPMPGWAFWSVPLLCYFLIRQDQLSYIPFWAYNASYVAYYVLFAPGIAIVSWEGLLPAAAAQRAGNLVFTLMQSSLALVGLWIYRTGVRSYAQYKLRRKPLAVGIGGDSGSGKHSLACVMTDLLGASNVVRLHGDDYHRWPRGHEAWQSLTHLNPRSNYFQQPIEHIHTLKSGLPIQKSTYDHATGDFTPPATVSPNKVILFLGLHPFVYQRMRESFDIKIFLDTEDALRRYWKTRRDIQERGHSAQKVQEELERREEDSQRYIRSQRQFADWIIQYFSEAELDPTSDNPPRDLRVRHTISSSVVEVEGLADELSKRSGSGLRVSWTMEPDLLRQVLEVDGILRGDDVRAIAYKLFPDLEEWLGVRPQWSADLDGVNQLVFLVLLAGLYRRA